jgi:hypothetical protein
MIGLSGSGISSLLVLALALVLALELGVVLLLPPSGASAEDSIVGVGKVAPQFSTACRHSSSARLASPVRAATFLGERRQRHNSNNNNYDNKALHYDQHAKPSSSPSLTTTPNLQHSSRARVSNKGGQPEQTASREATIATNPSKTYKQYSMAVTHTLSNFEVVLKQRSAYH